MTGASERRWLAVTPRDTVIVRDGRNFDAGATGSAATPVSPWPSTLAGAVTTALSSGVVVEPQAVRGPVLGRLVGDRWVAHFPVPADLGLPAAQAGLPRPRGVVRLRPMDPVPGAGIRTDLSGAPAMWLAPPAGAEDVMELSGLLPGDALVDYLADELKDGIDLAALRWVRPEKAPLVDEPRVGLARDGQMAREGFLYSMTHQRRREGWSFLVELVDSAESAAVTPTGPVPLGGRARFADVELAGGVAWPSAPDAFPGGRVLLYVATPALWPGGWSPPLPAGVTLMGACVGDPVVVSTSSVRDARARDKSLLDSVVIRWAVPAGAVYLLQFADHDASGWPGAGSAAERAARWAAQVHGTALGPARHHPGGGSASHGAGSPGTDRTATAGFGVVLTGRWGMDGAGS